MAKYKETIDLYDDTGKLLKSGVPLEKISPVINPATRKIIDLTKRTVAVNLAGIQDGLKVGKVAKGHVLGRELNLDIVGNKDAVVSKIKEMVQVAEGDDTNIREFNGGKLILVEVPKVRLEAASTYDVAVTTVAAATTLAIVDQFNVDPFDAAMVKAAVWGSYPHTMDLSGANVTSILSIPQNNEGLGYALRNIPVNHVVMMTNKNAMQGAALSSTFEQAGMFEMGNAVGPFER
ncbi:MAG: methyl-coenzyme M reductase subunit beta, partial [Methanoculleus sp.]